MGLAPNDHRALIEQARAGHQPLEQNGQTFCTGCTVFDDLTRPDSGPYPCLTTRLADALAQSDQYRREAEEAAYGGQELVDSLREELESARASQAETVQARAEAEARIGELLERDDAIRRAVYNVVPEYPEVVQEEWTAIEQLASSRDALARELATANNRVRMLLQDDANAYHRSHRGYVLSNCPTSTCQQYHAEISALAAALAARGEGTA